jgi:hypothetical protein
LSWNFLASSLSDRGCGPAAVDLDAGLEFLAGAGGHAPDGGEDVRERRAATLVLDAAHQGGQGETATDAAGLQQTCAPPEQTAGFREEITVYADGDLGLAWAWGRPGRSSRRAGTSAWPLPEPT